MISDARDQDDVIHAQQVWIQHRFRGALIQRRVLVRDPLTSADNHPCDAVEFKATDGKTRIVYFRYPFTTFPGQPPGSRK